MDIINIGILAHVDAGKTTLTEQMLYKAGVIRSIGSVDKGSAHTDTMDIERRRGISVRASCVDIEWQGSRINIIDTPGHMDFSSEIELSLLPLECAIMVISAAEGVQSQTRSIYRALKKMNIPVLFFINKIDRAGADMDRVVDEVEAELNIKIADFTKRTNLINLLCENDDELLEYCIENDLDKIEHKEICLILRRQLIMNQASAFVAGSAMNLAGVDELLDMIIKISPRFAEKALNEKKSDSRASAIVFKVEHSKTLGRIVYIKLLSGSIKNRDVIYNVTREINEKIVQIRKTNGVKIVDYGVLGAGEIGILTGLSSTCAGDILLSTEMSQVPAYLKNFNVSGSIAAPLLNSKITPENEKDYPALVAAIEELSAENPSLNMTWEKEERELKINVAGPVQLEILQEMMADRFALNVNFDEPMVIYKETPTIVAEGFDAYTMPKPCWAILKFLIEPGDIGSGVKYKSVVNADKIFPAYQAQVEQALPDALRQGPLGWEVCDIKITLIDGEHHVMHTHPLDFIVATPLAIMNGLVNAKMALLEPLYKFSLNVPEEMGGRIMNEIITMRGEIDTPAVNKGVFKLEGTYPVSTGMNFPTRLASMSRGQAMLSIEFGGYQKCELSLGRTVPYRGISPLDRAKYILHVRHSL